MVATPCRILALFPSHFFCFFLSFLSHFLDLSLILSSFKSCSSFLYPIPLSLSLAFFLHLYQLIDRHIYPAIFVPVLPVSISQNEYCLFFLFIFLCFCLHIEPSFILSLLLFINPALFISLDFLSFHYNCLSCSHQK